MTRKRRQPGDPSPRRRRAEMIRVNQAGEFGAKRIYEGQLAILGESDVAPVIEEMAIQEQRHLDAFDSLMREEHVRPTALTPLWRAAGFALGAGTALLGRRAAMACTVAVEDVINDHYRQQLEDLGDDDPALSELIEEFRQDELAHRATGLEHGAEETPGYPVLTGAIRAATRLAISLSKKI